MAIQLAEDNAFLKSPSRDVMYYNIILCLICFKIILEAVEVYLPSQRSLKNCLFFSYVTILACILKIILQKEDNNLSYDFLG